jgi:hypothetical protein
MYLSPERCVVSMSLRSVGLSKDPKDAQRLPSCFPDVAQIGHFGELSGVLPTTTLLLDTWHI